MRYRNISNWSNIDQTRGLLFFVQRLDELTFPYSLDSYKASTTGIITLVDEALELLGDPYVASGNLGAVKHVFDELNLRLKGNFAAKSIFNSDIGSVLRTNLDGNIKGVIGKLRVFRSEMDPEAYLAEIAHRVMSHDQVQPKKSQLELLAKEFASLLQYLGVSREHINNALVNAFYGQDHVTDTAYFRVFCKAVYPHAHKFRVGITTSEEIRDVSFDVLNSKSIMPYVLIKGEFDDDEQSFVDTVEAYHKENGGQLLICNVYAPDANAAATMATQRIGEAINFQKLFSHKLEVNISGTAVTEQSCCADDLRTVPALNNHMHYIKDLKAPQAINAAKKCHQKLSLNVGPDARKFKNIFNLHGISLSSTNDDIQMINLWTCLETLVPSDHTTSKISNSVKRIMPILSLRYYHRITLSLLHDILRWDRRNLSSVLKRSEIDNQLSLFEKFLSLLREEQNDDALVELLSKCRDFELLRYRIANVAKLLRDPQKASENLERHERMVTWQFYRIYRCRNGIVHTGESPRHIKYLVENAHDYFDQSLAFCIDVSSWKNGFETFSSCFDFAASEYKQYVQGMKAGDQSATVWQLPKQRDRSFIFPELEQE